MQTKIALVGAGYWGSNILRVLHELGALSLVCDTDERILQQAKARYPNLKATSDLDEVLRSDADAVAIATPARTHFEIAKRVIEAGKDVFVEKPLALTLNDAENLKSLSLSRKKILMVGHILRYHPAVEKLKELIVSGKLGKINYVYSNRLNFGKLRVEENILWSFAPHDISVMLYLLDELPESVTAFGAAYLNENRPDVTLTTLEFKSGVKGHVYVSWFHPFKEQKFIVAGEAGMAVFDDTRDIDKLVLYPHRVEWKGEVPFAVKADGVPVEIQKSEPLKAELSHFIECVSTRKTPKTDAEEGLKVLKVLMLSQNSLDKKGEKMTLNGDEPLAQKKYFVHPTAFVDEGAQIGSGTKIWHFAHVMAGAKLGENCVVAQNCFVGSRATLGNGVKLQNNVSVYDLVELEDNVFVGPSAVFTNDTNPRAKFPKGGKWVPTRVREGASIGANSTILCGIEIGKSAFIGAGAVVTKNVPDYAVMVGNPAKILSYMCECGEKLKFEKDTAACGKCGKKYSKSGEKVTPLLSSH
ncbi:MAG: Gfo/Idh/MocA family oxidoreductase [Bacteroidetes bacterium]|nr:Gfo/Idh/MocA family oxidoreductase [Bacteroidota bacterium]